MSSGLSNFFGAIAAWLCLAPIAFAREAQSMQSALAPVHPGAPHCQLISLSDLDYRRHLSGRRRASRACTPQISGA